MRNILAYTGVALLFVAISSTPVEANLQEKMDELFDTMSNVTTPGVYETQARGAFSGGGYRTKARIYDQNLFQITPLSAEAGCGGLDLYGGSFSFINKEQFIQLMRSVAANAQGYAFHLALNSICPTCNAEMEKLARKINQLNRYFGNSCQLAKGIVNDTWSAVTGEQNNKESLISTFEGAADTFGSFFKSDNTNAARKAEQVAPDRVAKEIKGNLVWRQLIKHQVPLWFLKENNNPKTSGGGIEFAETLMSLTGSIIVGDLEADRTNSGETRKTTYLPGNKITVEDLMKGGILTGYSCDTHGEDGCLKPILRSTNTEYKIKGMEELVREMLLGTKDNPGIVFKATNINVQSTVTDEEKAFMVNLKGSMGSLLMRLAKYSENGARTFAESVIPYIAYEMTEKLILSMLEATNSAQFGDDSPLATKHRDQLTESYEKILDELRRIKNETGNYLQQLQKYNLIVELVQKKPFGIPSTSSDTSGSQNK